jgi:hippurate hydrolase
MRLINRPICLFSLIATPFLAANLVHADVPAQEGAAVNTRSTAVKEQIGTEFGDLEKLYKFLHSHPELSLQETATSAKLAQIMKDLGFNVTTEFGGHGIVCIFKNGDGPTVMVRTDMDALPVVEKTDRPYASTSVVRDKAGQTVGVMHACGHDMHMTCWIGTARTLVALKDHWKGTLMFIGQPAEEVGSGARMMLEAGLFKKFPKPDFALALHCDARQRAGHLTFSDGLAMANVDSVDVLVKGRGGHGSAPHTTIDPIVLAARMVLDFQTIVSREINPTDPAVVTVGSIHGGTKHNIIPNEVKMQITVRSTKDEVRAHILNAIKRIAKGIAESAGAPEPEVTVNMSEFTPALHNDQKLTREIVGHFQSILGSDKVHERPPVMGGEDFSRYGREGVPIFMYFLGTIDDDRWNAAQKPGAPSLPSLHSDSFWPMIEPSIHTGVYTMSMAVMKLMNK